MQALMDDLDLPPDRANLFEAGDFSGECGALIIRITSRSRTGVEHSMPQHPILGPRVYVGVDPAAV